LKTVKAAAQLDGEFAGASLPRAHIVRLDLGQPTGIVIGVAHCHLSRKSRDGYPLQSFGIKKD
jgi:hypothetical protein